MCERGVNMRHFADHSRTTSMKVPRYTAITLSLDTEAYRARRPDERSQNIHYLIDRLLAGEEVARSALEHYGIKVELRDATSPEILREAP